MKKLCLMLSVLLVATASFATDSDDSIVTWKNIVGVITSQGVDNPVSTNIHSGTFAWTTRNGRARVDLASGATSFGVERLDINGTMFSGTPGPITAVTGTLVCNAGTNTESIHDTQNVPLSVRGNAHFSGHISVPASCGNPLFLIRIATPAGAAGRWIATGTERFIGDDGL